MSEERFVIVGGGMAGAKAAESLRNEGFDGDLVLIGDEGRVPYERPPLSKDFLRDEASLESTFVHPQQFYDEHSIELRTGTRATELRTGARELVLDGGETLRFDKLLLATGAEPRRLPIEGAELEGIHYLRTIEDSQAIREHVGSGMRLVVVGAGWIGSEVAASARQLGAEVTLVEPLEVPLQRVLGDTVGGFYRDVHAEQGVQLRLGTGVEGFAGNGAVERVRLSGGEEVECELVVVGVGVAPRTGLAEAAGLEVDNGVVVDERLETSVPGIFAAGDVANHRHPHFGPLRVEHWANALNQGLYAGRAMLGAGDAYERVPYFFSDQFDVGMEYSGFATPDDELVLRGDPAGGEFIAFWLRDERVVAGMNVNVWDVVEPIQALIRGREPVDRERLADVGAPLEAIAVGAR
jgi:3-phenylpropionate/trans-cinnamate dioxygenase ferredoxin reductase component